jgi:hypothetical protein
MKKRLLILTGPQGSGNHMWSKIFSESPQVKGWEELTKEYWVGHGNEPFARIWEEPELFLKIEWPHEYYFTSISCPYMSVGGPVMKKEEAISTPKYKEFIEYAEKAGFEITLAVIGRDKNILSHQQSRVRTQITWPIFLEKYNDSLKRYDHTFISTELVYLYEHSYIKQLSKLLNWPIDIEQDKLTEILKDNTNLKYIKSVEEFWLDEHMTKTAKKNGDPLNPYVYRDNHDQGIMDK